MRFLRLRGVGQGMFLRARWRASLSVAVIASAVYVAAPAEPAAAAPTGCFTISVDNALRMDVPELDEASGLVVSRQMPGVLWTHNDDDPGASNAENNRIYAVNEAGDLLATVQFNLSGANQTVPGPKFVELEDISYGPGPGGNPNWLYLADTGDNNLIRDYASVYRFPEPVFSPDPGNPVTIQISESQLDGTRFRYQSYINPSQIKVRNVEGMFIDPATGNLFLFEKGLHAIDADGNLADGSALPRIYSHVYRVKHSKLFPSDPTTVRLATVDSYVQAQQSATVYHGITGADISADGTIIAVKNSEETFYWHRDPNEAVLTTFANDHESPCRAPDGMKGEALGIDPISTRFVIIREGLLSPIWKATFTNQTHECFGLPATIVGTAGDDVINGTAGADVIVTFGGNDQVNGYKGRDRICLGPGDDYAHGGKLRDRIDGGWGADTIIGGNGYDILWGRSGVDTISGYAHDDILYGGDGQDVLAGGSGDDAIYGMDHADVIRGKSDSDFLSGGRGADSIEGGLGNDALTGGDGTDACDGGDGTDTAASCEEVTGVP